ncbi:hypothetical protein [Nitratifractor salsuginis]|uniref:Uncharacterized protein n=1 Tax=Nitratifractor salsuginis (strain DSM 16511 / JCM 12458 / E9I37-1) TaxID=749222 RepID=E6X0P4_NITSE|nr:hypothetical protein [Nitratifractor salsuginis]ADV45764.1 hypothetical protein Nitsa_0494 [Nitratifractor salsuginis DSM 16511]
MKILIKLFGPLFFLAAALYAGPATEAPSPSIDQGSKPLGSDSAKNESELDRLIDRYRSAPPGEKKRLLPQIRTRIVEQVTGEQKLAIVEAIKLKKLKQDRTGGEKSKSAGQKKSGSSGKRRHSHVRRTCRSVGCMMNRVRRSLRRFFHKATQKRRRPARMPSPEEILKEKRR